MKDRYTGLYDYMSQSRDPKNMKAFGCVMTEMMDVMLAKLPEQAEEMIGQLESIRWHQYLTPKEAQKIVDGMNPKAPWTREVWRQAMTQLGLPMEEEPYYNSCALWATMNQVYTDHAQTIADNILKKPLAEIPADQIVPGIRALAVDLLKDKDGNFSIRRYHNL